MGVQSIATAFIATTRAELQTAIATRLLKTAQKTGAPHQIVELVRQAADTAARALDASAAQTVGGFDTYA